MARELLGGSIDGLAASVADATLSEQPAAEGDKDVATAIALTTTEAEPIEALAGAGVDARKEKTTA